MWTSVALSQQTSRVYYAAKNAEDCSKIKSPNCHNFLYYSIISVPSNATIIFLKGTYNLPLDLSFNLKYLSNITLKGCVGVGKEKPELQCFINIRNSHKIRIENLGIKSLALFNNSDVEICNTAFTKGIYSKSSLFTTNITIHNTSFHTVQENRFSIFLINAQVHIENVAISNAIIYTCIYIEMIGSHSSLMNITINCNNCLGLVLIGKHDTSHINLTDIVVTGGKIKIVNISSHLSLFNIKASVYHDNPCNFTVLLVDQCANNININNVNIDGGEVAVKNFRNNITLKSVLIKSNQIIRTITIKNIMCSLLFVNGNNNSSQNVKIFGVKAIGGTITLSNINNNLSITDVFTNDGLFVAKNGNHINIANIVVVGMISIVYNGNDITLRNITGYYNDLRISLQKYGYSRTLNTTLLIVANCGSYISVTDVTMFGGMVFIFRNRNRIRVQNVTIHANNVFKRKTGARLFLDPTFKIHASGLSVIQNHDCITIKKIKISNDIIMVYGNGNEISMSDIHIDSYQDTYGVFVTDNKDNIMLSDITINGYAEVYIARNGNYLMIKHKLQAFQFVMVHNGNNISVINASTTNLSFQSNGDNITLNNVTITMYSDGCGLVFLYNNNPRGRIILTNVTVTGSNCGIYAYGWSVLYFLDHPSRFINNTSSNNGAGMQISRSIVLISNTEVYFINNTAHGVGGAIYVDNTILEMEEIIGDCTFQNFKPVFVNNTALLAGDDVYNGRIFKCTGVETYNALQKEKTSPFTQAINCSNITYLQHFPTPLSVHITSTPIGVCLCNDNETDCNTRFADIQLYPGQYATLSLVTVGMCGGISPSVLILSNTSTVEVLLDSKGSQVTKRNCKNFTYQLKMATKDRNGTFLIKHKFDSTDNQDRLDNSYITARVFFLPCPVGLQLLQKVCHCNHVISASSECDINWMPHPIRRTGNNWLYYNHDYNCTVAHKYCPFDYCNTSSIYISLDEGDVQCANGRAGILCGRCRSGLSLMLGSNKCEHCSNKYLSLLIAFILAGIVLVAFLLVCNLTVSVGSINGLLFYANIVKLNEVNLFPNSVTVPVLSQFIAWLNLDLGVQTCFFNGLDGYWNTWLQYAFPIYIWLLVGAIIIGSHYSSRVCRLCGNNAVPVLATLILMSYSKLLQMVTKSLMSSTINCEGVIMKVWSVDGNIDYLSTKHIPLFVMAILFLIAGLVYTGLVFTAQWLQRYSGKCFKSSHDPVVKLKPFIDAYTGAYKDKYRYWTGLLLIIRLILTPVFSYTTNTIPIINNYIIAFISAIALHSSTGIYRYKVLNALEVFHFLNLGLLTLLNMLSSNLSLKEDINLIITAVSVGLCFTTFIGSVLAHVYMKFFSKRCHVPFCMKFSKMNNEEQILLEREETYSPSHVIMRRESMIFDFSINDVNDEL